jgi:hypothetical protein
MREQEQLKSQLVKAVPKTALIPLQNRRHGFRHVTVAQLLAHLMTEYGTITNNDLERNHAELISAWNPSDGINALWARVENCKQFAIDGERPYKEIQLIGYVLTIFQESGVFGTTVEDWRKKKDTTWTWDAFYDDFKQANIALGQTATAKSAGYQTANAATDAAETTNEFHVDMYYCFTHGLSTNAKHTSATCKTPGPKHDKKATWSKRSGGAMVSLKPIKENTTATTSV